MSKFKVLITGGGGFVGSHLLEAELKLEHQVVVLDIAPPDKVRHLLDHENFRYVQGDILNQAVVEPLVQDADLVYHLAAIADPTIYVRDPLKVLNVDMEGFQAMIKLAYKHKKKFVFTSTSEVYGKNLKVPWHENDDRVLGTTKTPRWSYSTSKALAEHYCFAYSQKGLPVVILRFFNFYGPRLDFLGKGRVMPSFLDKFLKGEPVEVVEPGDQTRCFTYIDDAIKGIVKAAYLSEAEGEAFNLGDVREVSILELAEMMKKIGNFKSEIILIPAEKKYGRGYDDIFRRVPAISKAKEILKWEPTTALEEGLKRTIDYYLKNESI